MAVFFFFFTFISGVITKVSVWQKMTQNSTNYTNGTKNGNENLNKMNAEFLSVVRWLFIISWILTFRSNQKFWDDKIIQVEIHNKLTST